MPLLGMLFVCCLTEEYKMCYQLLNMLKITREKIIVGSYQVRVRV